MNNDPEGNGAVAWNGTYRFGLEGNYGNNECIATFPADIWNRVKTETLSMQYRPADPTQYQVRVTNGWFAGDTNSVKGIETKTTANAAIYNLAGQKVDASYKGIVIKNGKKYVVK